MDYTLENSAIYSLIDFPPFKKVFSKVEECLNSAQVKWASKNDPKRVVFNIPKYNDDLVVLQGYDDDNNIFFSVIRDNIGLVITKAPVESKHLANIELYHYEKSFMYRRGLPIEDFDNSINWIWTLKRGIYRIVSPIHDANDICFALDNFLSPKIKQLRLAEDYYGN